MYAFSCQVVQGLAGSLDNLNIDNVILHNSISSGVISNIDDAPEAAPSSHETDTDTDFGQDIDPLQVISDPSFPPYPIIGETPLTKPNVKINVQENTSPPTTTTTTTTTQKPLDWKKGINSHFLNGLIIRNYFFHPYLIPLF